MQDNRKLNEQQADEQASRGRITASELRNGPLAERGCTDTLCCLLFVIFVALSTYISYYGYKNGNPTLVLTPVDSDNRYCGQGINTGFPMIYFVAPNPKTLWRTVCVKSCPNVTSSELQCSPNSNVTSCQGKALSDMAIYGIDFYKDTLIYNSTPILNNLCMPINVAIQNAIQQGIQIGSASQLANDFSITWPMMLGSVGIAFLIGFIFMLLIRCFSGIITWIFIISFVILMFTATAIFAVKYFNLSVDLQNLKNINLQNYQQTIQSSVTQNTFRTNPENVNYYLAGMIIFSVLSLVSVLALCCLCAKIKLTIAIMKTSAIFVQDNPMAILLPFLNIIAIMLYFIYFIAASIYLYSTGTKVNQPNNQNYPYGSFQHSQNVTIMGYYQMFSLLWILAFLLASLDFILVSACSLWYFQYGADDQPYNPVRTSIYRLFRFHLGTIAFGSIVLAIVWAIQICLEYFIQQSKATGADQNPIMSFLLRCLSCYLDCFERFIRFLNKNAYTLTAMTGSNFCESAKDAFSLIFRNALRFSLVGGIGELFVVLGKLFIALATAVIGYVILIKFDQFKNISSPIPSTLIFAIIGFCIGRSFMTVYGTVADAVLLIFTMEEEIEQYHGKTMKVNRCPDPLQEFMDKHV